MMRITTLPRSVWQKKVEEQGMTYHTIDEEIYWDESAYYSFTSSEIDELESASEELQKICIEATEHIITNRLYEKLQQFYQQHQVPQLLRQIRYSRHLNEGFLRLLCKQDVVLE